ncbi:MAG: InlB B-repeat-containing protein [Clostridia bacterium]|nr:InlB B-repeat-containing protein [Clostridia bacterium]
MKKTVGKIFALLLSFVLVCTTVAVPVFAEATLPNQFVKLASPSAEAEVGATVEIPVSINNPNTLNGVMVKVTWDPTMLKADPTKKMGKWNCYTKPADNADGVNMYGAMFDLNGNDVANGVLVFGGAAGYEFEDYTTEISLGTLKFTVLEAAAGKNVAVTVDTVGTYATSLGGKKEILDTPVNATIKVAGAAVEPEISGIEVAAGAVEIADADKADEAKIIAAVKAAITAITVKWTEGKEDTTVTADDAEYDVNADNKNVAVTYGGFTDYVAYTVAAPIVPDEPEGNPDATLPGQFVKLASPSGEVEVGATVEIPVSINNPNTLNGVMVKVTWDPTMLKADPTKKMGKWNCYTKPADNADGVNMYGAMFDLNGNDVANGVLVFGGAAGYEFEDYEIEISLGTLKFTVLEAAAGKDVAITVDTVGTYATSLGGKKEILDTPVNATIKVAGAAEPEIKYYTVTYKVNGEVVDTFENVEEGAAVPASTYVVPEGYDFTGWGEVPATVTEDLTFEGTATIKTFTVIYKVDGEVVDTFENVEYGATVPASTYTAPEGYTFSGWGEVPATVTEDLTFEGTTEEIIPDPVFYTVTFVVDGVEETIEVEEGTAIGDQMPADPEKEGFEFTGWFDAEGEAVDAETIVNGDMTVTANFEKDPMDVNGDEVVDSKDSIYLLNHCALPDLYPVDEDLDFDFNGDGVVNSKDAVEHLRLLTLPEIYSLR